MRQKQLLGGALSVAVSFSIQAAYARGPEAPRMASAPARMAAPAMRAPAPAMRAQAPMMRAPSPMRAQAPAMRQYSQSAFHPRAAEPQRAFPARREASPAAFHGRAAEPQHASAAMREPGQSEFHSRVGQSEHSNQNAHNASPYQSQQHTAAHEPSSHERMSPQESQHSESQARGQQSSRAMTGQESRPAQPSRSEMAHEREHEQPINSRSSASTHSEHEQAMMQLRQGHGEQPEAGQNHGMRNAGHVAAGVVAGAALTGLAAHQMSGHNNENHANGAHNGANNFPEENGRGHAPSAEAQSGRGQEHTVSGRVGTAGTRGVANVPPSPAYANPRRFVAQGPKPTFRKTPDSSLSYRHGVVDFPRQGDKHKGIPGVYDPGGYLRTPQSAHTRINQEYAREQLSKLPNWQRDMEQNKHNWVSNRSAWPWHLPQQSVWGNSSGAQQAPVVVNEGGGYNPYLANAYNSGQYGGLSPYFGYPYGANGNSNFWNNWNNFQGWNNWNNQYANSGPNYGGGDSGFMGFLGNMFGNPEGVGIGAGSPNDWLSNLLYSTGYSTGGNTYPANYFAMNGYVPTPYVFNVASGQFWQPGVGYSDYLPNDYQAPITVSAQEVVPSFDDAGNITGYQPQTFYNDAYWDNDAQSYGYYDYRKKFHWAKFPGLAASTGGYSDR